MPLHFIGIGGDGMSALARVLHERGLSVRGSDLRENARTRALRELGIPVRVGHDPAHVQTGDPLAVVYSSAIRPDNVELTAARQARFPMYHRQEVLGKLLRSRRTVGVAGTHGKTTTSAMIASLLWEAGKDPTFLVGAPTPSLGGRHGRWGRGEWLVAEIDESDGFFTQFPTEIAVVTNVGCDHLNHYGDEETLLRAFAHFVSRSRRVVLCADDPHTPFLKEFVGEAYTFGLDNDSADLQAHDVEQHRAQTRARLTFRGEPLGELELEIPAPGAHNVKNALAALLAGYLVGLNFPSMLAALKRFQLPERRFQILEENGLVIVDDYAHLPEQIEANLVAAREGWRPKRLISLFQPHRYTRMSYLNGAFARALRRADLVVVTDIYPAFEDPIPGVDARSVVEALRREHKSVHYFKSSEETYEFLRKRAEPGDFLIGFGPGDVWRVLYRLVREG